MDNEINKYVILSNKINNIRSSIFNKIIRINDENIGDLTKLSNIILYDNNYDIYIKICYIHYVSNKYEYSDDMFLLFNSIISLCKCAEIRKACTICISGVFIKYKRTSINVCQLKELLGRILNNDNETYEIRVHAFFGLLHEADLVRYRAIYGDVVNFNLPIEVMKEIIADQIYYED